MESIDLPAAFLAVIVDIGCLVLLIVLEAGTRYEGRRLRHDVGRTSWSGLSPDATAAVTVALAVVSSTVALALTVYGFGFDPWVASLGSQGVPGAFTVAVGWMLLVAALSGARVWWAYRRRPRPRGSGPGAVPADRWTGLERALDRARRHRGVAITGALLPMLGPLWVAVLWWSPGGHPTDPASPVLWVYLAFFGLACWQGVARSVHLVRNVRTRHDRES